MKNEPKDTEKKDPEKSKDYTSEQMANARRVMDLVEEEYDLRWQIDFLAESYKDQAKKDPSATVPVRDVIDILDLMKIGLDEREAKKARARNMNTKKHKNSPEGKSETAPKSENESVETISATSGGDGWCCSDVFEIRRCAKCGAERLRPAWVDSEKFICYDCKRRQRMRFSDRTDRS